MHRVPSDIVVEIDVHHARALTELAYLFRPVPKLLRGIAPGVAPGNAMQANVGEKGCTGQRRRHLLIVGRRADAVFAQQAQDLFCKPGAVAEFKKGGELGGQDPEERQEQLVIAVKPRGELIEKNSPRAWWNEG